MIDFERHCYELEVFGFTVVPDFISAQTVASLKDALVKALDVDLKKYGKYRNKAKNHIAELASHGGVFLELLEHPDMLAIYRKYLGPDCILYVYSSTLLAPDDPVPAQTVHVDSSRHVPNYHTGLQMTLALDPFTPENGATLYLPGSHRKAEAPSLETFEKHAVTVSRPAGAALFWDPHCYHRAGVNTSPAVRFALSTYAVRGFMKQRFDYPRIVGAAAAAKLSPSLRTFLGFDRIPPDSVETFYENAERQTYKLNTGQYQ